MGYVFNIFTGTLDLTAAPGSTPTGNPNTFAGFSNAGFLESIPGRAFTVAHNGDDFNFSVIYDNTGGYQLNNRYYGLTATVNSPNDNINIENKFVDLDPTSTGFQIGTNGSAATLLANAFQHHGTSNTGGLQLINNNINLGNGTDPISVNGLIYNSANGTINSGVSLTGQMQGYSFQPQILAGVTLSQSVRAFFDNANIHIAVPGHESFSSAPNIDEIQNNHNMNAYEAGGTFPLFTGNSGYQGLSVFPNIGTMNTGGFQGINVNPSVTSAGSGYIAGINVAMSNVLGFTGDLPYTINAQGGRLQLNSIANGTQSGGVIQTELDTGNYPVIGGGGPYGLNNLGGSFRVAPGSPIGGGAFGIGNNLGIGVFIEDNVPPDSTGLSLGFVMNGFLTQAGVVTGKTMDSLTFMGAGASFPPSSTGGTMTSVNMFRAIGLVPGGGSLSIGEIVGFKVEPVLTLASPINAWGIRVDDTNADNWFAKNVVIGGITKLPTGAYALDVTGDAAISGALTVGNGATGSFISADAKTITVTSGIITSII